MRVLQCARSLPQDGRDDLTNLVLLVGHLGGDPEVKDVGDTQVCNLRVATKGFRKDDDGNRQSDWHNVVVWGKGCGFVKEYLKKGSLVSLAGRLETRSYTKDGELKYVTEVVTNQVTGLDRREPKPF